MKTQILLLLVALVGLTLGKAVIPCKWPLFKQCDPTWANEALGTSSETICQAGCAMSSVSMALNAKGEKISGQESDPQTLNKWLIGHSGYEDNDLIMWNSIQVLGSMHLQDFTTHLTQSQIQGYVSQCHPVIANVRDGTHWVLIIGYDTADANTFYVNDPGFTASTYAYSGMSNFVVYTA